MSKEQKTGVPPETRKGIPDDDRGRRSSLPLPSNRPVPSPPVKTK